MSHKNDQQGQFCEDNLTKLIKGLRDLIGEKSKHEKCRYGCLLSLCQPVFNFVYHRINYGQITWTV